MVRAFSLGPMMPASLSEFSESQRKPQVSWCDKLPADVRASIIETDCSVRTVVAWLRDELGYAEATQGKVDLWRRTKRAELGRTE
jgi:hypothetical protein